MLFRTEYVPAKANFTLTPRRPVVMLGSCFSDNIASKMRDAIWDAVNPLGTLYNPVSIASSLETFLFSEDFEKRFGESLFQDSQGKWRSFFGDFRFAGNIREESFEKALAAKEELQSKLSKADALFITFGTSICYALCPECNEGIESKGCYDRIEPNPTPTRSDLISATVANCHKLPASRFEKYRLSIEDIAEIWIPICKRLKESFPQLRIVFTVSPVRHLKDGFVANNRSKSILLLAIEDICNRLNFCSYFPAYEILNDDLRDYRFYASDMAHPSEQAVDYIWEIFKKTYLDSEGMNLIKEGEKIMRMKNHRPLIATDREREQYSANTMLKYEDFIRLRDKE